MKKKWVLLFLILPICVFSRIAIDFDFFGKKVSRRYYPDEFKLKLIPQKKPFLLQKIAPYFFSYKGSPSISLLKVSLTKDDIHSLKMKAPNEDIFFLSYFRESQNKGAVEISTRMEIPEWTKTLSFWIYDEGSGVDGAFYIRTEKGLKRYLFGKIKHKGWKNFNVILENYRSSQKTAIEKFKFFNRNFPGGANMPKVILKLGNFEAFSILKEEKDLNESIKPIPLSSIISEGEEDEKERNNLKITKDSHSLYRIKKGVFWSKQEVLSFFAQIEKPATLEVYGSLLNNRNKIFALQSKVFTEKGKFRIDFLFPEELSKLHNRLEESGVIFWGFGIIPLQKESPDFTIERIWIWDKIKNPGRNSSLN